MVKVGIVGIGFMGMIHYLAYQRVAGAQVTAICSRDPKKRAGDWTGIQGNFGPKGEQMDLSGVRAFESYAEMLADPTIDLVDLCLPPAQHATAAIQALEHGKHVLVEKPIALTNHEADAMLEAARRSGRQLLVAHVLPFFPEYRFAREAITSGRYGEFRGGVFKRIIADPTAGWLPDFFDPTTVGGPVVDLHIHDAHFIRSTCGMPRGVFSTGRLRGETPEFFSTQFLFDDPDLQVMAISGVIPQAGRQFTHGFEIHLAEATLLYDLAGVASPACGTPLVVLTQDGQCEQPTLDGGDEIDAFARELTETVSAITSGTESSILSGQIARDALAMCHAQTESIQSGLVTPLEEDL